MQILVRFFSLFLPEHCYSDISSGSLPMTKECASLLLSKFLGIGLILFSSCVKLPQIWKIVRYFRADGISIISVLMEISVNVFSFSYHKSMNFPMTTYGETIIVFIQNLLIGFFVTHLEKKIHVELWNIIVVFHLTLLFGVMKRKISQGIIDMLWMICIPLSIANKIPQIVLTHVQKKRGNYSRLSALLRAFGSLCRVFTTFMEISDTSVKCSSVINLILTSTIFMQSIIYPMDKEEKML